MVISRVSLLILVLFIFGCGTEGTKNISPNVGQERTPSNEILEPGADGSPGYASGFRFQTTAPVKVVIASDKVNEEYTCSELKKANFYSSGCFWS